MVSIRLNSVSMLMEKFIGSIIVNVFSNVIGMISVGMSVVCRFCMNSIIIRNMSIMVLSSVLIICLMVMLIKCELLYVIL